MVANQPCPSRGFRSRRATKATCRGSRFRATGSGSGRPMSCRAPSVRVTGTGEPLKVRPRAPHHGGRVGRPLGGGLAQDLRQVPRRRRRTHPPARPGCPRAPRHRHGAGTYRAHTLATAGPDQTRSDTQHGLQPSFLQVSGRAVLVLDGSPDRIRTGATALRVRSSMRPRSRVRSSTGTHCQGRPAQRSSRVGWLALTTSR
jgi:hypothetical protein